MCQLCKKRIPVSRQIREKILEHLGPRHVRPLRLVSHDWNQSAVGVLAAASSGHYDPPAGEPPALLQVDGTLGTETNAKAWRIPVPTQPFELALGAVTDSPQTHVRAFYDDVAADFH